MPQIVLQVREVHAHDDGSIQVLADVGLMFGRVIQADITIPSAALTEAIGAVFAASLPPAYADPDG
jgi:hypothetical protein